MKEEKQIIDTSLPPPHAVEIGAHYRHAREKHPYFCDMLLSSAAESLEMTEEGYFKMHLDGMRYTLEGQRTHNVVDADTVLSVELAEIWEAVARGDTDHAIAECYDAIAVLLRIVDVIEGVQPLGNPKATEGVD